MNEQIKLLALKAGMRTTSLHYGRRDPYDARCNYPGDYVAEAMGYGAEEGVTEWRSK